MATEIGIRQLLAERTMSAASELVVDEGNGSVRCLACGHRCLIRPGKAGICQVRFNESGTLRVPGGYVAGLQVDPIEKKPFFHAFPGRDALSFGMLGCDLHCAYCQNWVTSQVLRDDEAVASAYTTTADDLVQQAIRYGAPVVVSTYNEPLITADWAVQVFEKAREEGLRCGFVSNGNATPEVLEFIRPFVDLYKVDLKTFNDRSYRKLGAVLKNILDTIVRLKEMGFWVELVTLVVPGFNDNEDELREMARFIAGVSPDIPWHVTAFHPDYKMTDPPRTRVEQLLRAYDIGKEMGLRYVYPGNLPGMVGDREHTRCASCGGVLIRREGFLVLENRMRAGCCPDCSAGVPGVWEEHAPRQSVGDGYPRAVRV